MRNNILYIVISLILLLMASCYEDKSEMALERFPSLMTKAKSNKAIVAFFGDTLRFDPLVSEIQNNDTLELSDDSNYEYTWRLTLAASKYDTIMDVISKERKLNVIMNMVGPSPQNYHLFLDMTNKDTGLKAMFRWQVTVLSEYGQGLLISETSDDMNSDISLLMSRAYSQYIEADSPAILKRNIYSTINGNKLEGIVSEMAYLMYGKNKSIYALVKGKSLYGIDPITYNLKDQDLDFFTFPPAVFNPQSIKTYSGGSAFLLNNGDLQMFEMRKGEKFNYISEDSPYDFGNNFFVHAGSYSYSSQYDGNGRAVVYDKNKGKFLSYSNYGWITNWKATQTGAFEVTDVQDMDYIYGWASPDAKYRFLMKSISSGDYYIYEVATTGTKKVIEGSAIFDLSNCEDVKDATSYAISEAFNEFYYSIGNELKVVILNDYNPTSKVSYTLPAGETISHISIHGAGGGKGYTTWGEEENPETGELEPLWRDSKNNVITIVSYNESQKEGIIRTIPIQYGGTGLMAPDKYIKTYRGFDRITAITWQR